MKQILKIATFVLILALTSKINAMENIPEKPRIAVLNWDIRNNEIEEEADAVAEKIREVFVVSEQYTVVDRTMTKMILQEWERQETGHTEVERSIKIGEIYNVKLIVTGKLSRFQDGSWQVSCVTLDAETGVTQDAKTVDHKGDFFTLLNKRVPLMAAKIISFATGKHFDTDNKYTLPSKPESNGTQRQEIKMPIPMDILVLSSGDTDRADVLKMIVLDELGKNNEYHLLDIKEIPDYTTKFKYGIESYEVEEFTRTLRTNAAGPVPHIIVKANIKTIGQIPLKF